MHPSVPDQLKHLREQQNPNRYKYEQPVLYLPIPEMPLEPPEEEDKPDPPRVIHINLG